ncbi:MAG TPA: tRNA pseudouridine(55) synthase TruB [Bacteroidia bacterium]|jgi:tRNA pseudouridine55 synthase|nr:tRNA pseudouridine(55) synthase TruB [Bacteroidia bacterium]
MDSTEMDFSKGGYLLFDKPYKWTSFDAVGRIRWALRKKYGHKFKVGHAGTLDPLATGLLIICFGFYTKKINEYQDLEKEYEGVFTLGAFRPSFDKETEITETFPTEHITDEMMQQVARTFVGEIEQIPPAHSAIKINGKRAYLSAREGTEIEMKPRKVTIRSMEVKRLEGNNVAFKVVCAKGTYIRSLARDFGVALGSSAYLDTLVRTRIGQYELKNALKEDQLTEENL